MKKVLAFLHIFFFLALLSSQGITLNEVENHNWEATIHDETDHDRYLFLKFNRSAGEAILKITDLHLNEIETKSLKYEEVFIESPRHISLYEKDVDKPLFEIRYNENNRITLLSHNNQKYKVLSFETEKEVYERLKVQGILNSDRVRLRIAPNLEARKIDSLMNGNIVSILNRSDETMIIDDMNTYWFKVKTSRGLVGWSYGYFIEIGNVLYADRNKGNVIFLKTMSLDQGVNQRILFFKGNILANDTGWIGCDKILLFAKNKRIILTKFNQAEASPLPQEDYSSNPATNIFDFDGTLIKHFENMSMTLQFNKVSNIPVFFITEPNGMNDHMKWTNKCSFYDLNGRVIKQIIYDDSLKEYEFSYNGAKYKIKPAEPYTE